MLQVKPVPAKDQKPHIVRDDGSVNRNEAVPAPHDNGPARETLSPRIGRAPMARMSRTMPHAGFRTQEVPCRSADYIT